MGRGKLVWATTAAAWLTAESAGVTLALRFHDPAAWNAVITSVAVSAALIAVCYFLRRCFVDWIGGYSVRAAQEEHAAGSGQVHLHPVLADRPGGTAGRAGRSGPVDSR